jgi:redox-sensitive bicupin YhaK (pirin superfamily)
MNAALVDSIGFDDSSTLRKIVTRTRGRTHGPITRLVSPSDIGELIKPFVFLDYFEADPAGAPNFGWHPHSGIATLTLLLDGQTAYEETTGVKGILEPGGIEWMRAGGGVWHTGGPIGKRSIKGFQLWVALPPESENGPTESHYLSAADVPTDGAARVVLGSHGGAKSPISAAGLNYLDVRLAGGERWTYQPPAGHTVLWLAVHRGRLLAQTLSASGTRSTEAIASGELAVFDDSNASISVEADGETAFVLGSAVKHPHDLILGRYSVHTNRNALTHGEAQIQRIGATLFSAGQLR